MPYSIDSGEKKNELVVRDDLFPLVVVRRLLVRLCCYLPSPSVAARRHPSPPETYLTPTTTQPYTQPLPVAGSSLEGVRVPEAAAPPLQLAVALQTQNPCPNPYLACGCRPCCRWRSFRFTSAGSGCSFVPRIQGAHTFVSLTAWLKGLLGTVSSTIKKKKRPCCYSLSPSWAGKVLSE